MRHFRKEVCDGCGRLCPPSVMRRYTDAGGFTTAFCPECDGVPGKAAASPFDWSDLLVVPIGLAAVAAALAFRLWVAR